MFSAVSWVPPLSEPKMLQINIIRELLHKKICCVLYFFSTRLFDRRKSSARLCLYWPVSRCACAADCFYTGQSPDMQNPLMYGGGGGRRLVVGLPWGCCVSRSPKGGSGPSMLVVVEAGRWRRLHASKHGGQQDAGGWGWIEFCGETAIAAVLLLQCSTCPLVLWPPQLAWHALLPPVLGMSSLWPFSRCGAQLLLWFAGDAGAPLGM